jgi:hypothetical protein
MLRKIGHRTFMPGNIRSSSRLGQFNTKDPAGKCPIRDHIGFKSAEAALLNHIRLIIIRFAKGMH